MVFSIPPPSHWSPSEHHHWLSKDAFRHSRPLPPIQSKAFPAASVHSFFIHEAPTVCPLYRGLTLITIVVIMAEMHLDHQEQMLHPSSTSVSVLKMGADSQLEHREKFRSTTRRSRGNGVSIQPLIFPLYMTLSSYFHLCESWFLYHFLGYVKQSRVIHGNCIDLHLSLNTCSLKTALPSLIASTGSFPERNITSKGVAQGGSSWLDTLDAFSSFRSSFSLQEEVNVFLTNESWT